MSDKSPTIKENKKPQPRTLQIQRILDENCELLRTIVEYQNSGKLKDALCYQNALHRNLLQLMELRQIESDNSQK